MPKYVVERLLELATPTKGSNIAILGVAYKAGISDVRESPAENVAKELLEKGLNPLWIDPLVESFHNFEAHSGQVLSGAIVVTAQEGLAVKELASGGVPILDCTGAFKGIAGVEQL
jgi:UDP-N-acetyl-D-mannosaminuronate dehydrogenase